MFDTLRLCETIAKAWNERWPVGSKIFVCSRTGKVIFTATASEAYVADVDCGTYVAIDVIIQGAKYRAEYGTIVPYNPTEIERTD